MKLSNCSQSFAALKAQNEQHCVSSKITKKKNNEMERFLRLDAMLHAGSRLQQSKNLSERISTSMADSPASFNTASKGSTEIERWVNDQTRNIILLQNATFKVCTRYRITIGDVALANNYHSAPMKQASSGTASECRLR